MSLRLLTPEVIADPDNCVNCASPVQFGQDYCPACEVVMQAGVDKGICGFCKDILTDGMLDVGYCKCSLPTNNPPPILGAT